MFDFKKIARIMLVSVLAAGMSACSDDDPVENDANGDDDQHSSLTQEQQKQRLEAVAIEASTILNPEDQRQVIELANYWYNQYGGLDIPEEWEAAENVHTPAHILGHIGAALKHGDISTLAWGASNYYYEFSRFAGVYEADRYSWHKVAESSDIVFRFINAQGGQTVATVKATGSNNEVVYEDYDKYTIVAPRTVETTVVDNGRTLVHSVVNVNIDEQGHAVSMNVSADIANVHAEASFDATDTRIVSNGNIIVGGRNLVSYDAVVSGQNMADRAEWEQLIDNPTKSAFTAMFKTADATVDVLGKVQVKGNLSDTYVMYDNLFDKYFAKGVYDSKEAARQACQTACDELGRVLKGRLYFDGSNLVEAEIIYAPTLDEYENPYYPEYDSWEWYLDPLFKFSDGTTYSIGGYFDNGRFASVENTWTNLWNSYSRLWR